MKLQLLVLVSMMGMAIPALAHPALAHEAKGPNGGRLTDAGRYHVEMVAKPNEIEVFVSDAKEQPVAATGFRGLAILVIEGKPQRITLEPAGNDRLKGSSALPVPGNPKGVIQLTAPDGTVSQAKF